MQKRKGMALLLVVAMVVALFAGGDVSQAKPKDVNIRIYVAEAKKGIRMKVGEKKGLGTEVILTGLTPKAKLKKKYNKLKYASSNKKVATISKNGIIKAKKKGKAKITVTAVHDKKQKVTVKVTVAEKKLVKTIQLNKETITAEERSAEEIQLKATKILPKKADNKKIKWSSDNKKVATVTSTGLVTIGKAGEATITAKAADKGGAKATCKVIVTKKEDDKTDSDVPTEDIPSDDDSDVTPTATPGATSVPTVAPTVNPTVTPTDAPSDTPTEAPTDIPETEEDVDGVVFSPERETKATKDQDEFRTDVVYHEDGSVSYTNVAVYNSGMVFALRADGSGVDLSDCLYIEVDVDGPADSSLKIFNDATSWWNKKEVYEGEGGAGRRKLRYEISWLGEQGIDMTDVKGIALGFNSDCAGETVRIYSIRFCWKKNINQEVVVPTTDEYQFTLSEDTETEATKDREDFRTDVVYNADGSVRYTNLTAYKSGMVFAADPDRKLVDLSAYDYIEVDIDAPADIALKLYNDATAWNNKIELYEGVGESGRRTLRFSLAELAEKGLDVTRIDGIGMGISSSSDGETVRIYSYKAVKGEDSDEDVLSGITGTKYLFTEVINEAMSDATISQTTDAEGTFCIKMNFTENYQRVFFTLPENIDVSDYDTMYIKANVPAELSVEGWSDMLDKTTDNWWSAFATFANYSVCEGSTLKVTLAKPENAETLTGHLSIGTNKEPASGFGSEDYLIYAIVLASSTGGAENILLMCE